MVVTGPVTDQARWCRRREWGRDLVRGGRIPSRDCFSAPILWPTLTRDAIPAIDDAGPEAVLALIEPMQATLAALTARVQHREDQLATRRHNSSQPPSSDGLAQKTKSRREKSAKKPGGQRGHPGRTL
jgi:hypothetical protein